MKKDVIIIGAGQAGCMTSISLRQQKFKGSIVLIGSENFLPYQRPPLSKTYLSGEINKENLYLKSKDYFKKNNISYLSSKTVTKIDRDKKKIILDGKSEYKYERLVIATGSQVKKISSLNNKKSAYYLRSLDDANKLKIILAEKKDIAIIGAGYIGLEVASVASKQNIKVTIIEMDARPMKRSLSSVTADLLTKKHKEEGVKFIFNASVVDITEHKNKKIVKFDTGSKITIDEVIVGVGIKPNIELALGAGIRCEDGIIVDENCQTSDKSIFAVGDCSNHPNNIFRKRLRLESVQNAIDQAKTTASFIVGKIKPYNQVPWFWSNQYDISLQTAGIYEIHDDHLLVGSRKDLKFAAFYFLRTKLVAVEAVNYQRAFSKGKKLIQSESKNAKEVIKNLNL